MCLSLPIFILRGANTWQIVGKLPDVGQLTRCDVFSPPPFGDDRDSSSSK